MPWKNLGGAEADNKIPTLLSALSLFQNIVNAALILAGLVALLFIIFSGIKLILSGGDAKKVASARSTLTFAIIGLLLVFFSFAIVFFISTITGVDCIRDVGFSNCK